MADTVTLSSKHQIVVPREAREKLGVGAGDELLFLVKEDRVVLMPKPRSFTKRTAGLHKGVWKRAGKSYLKRERDSW